MKNDAAARLRALIANSKNRSKIGQVRNLYQEIEDARKAGVSLKEILAELNAEGLNMDLDSFKSMLYRVRKAAQRQEEKTMPAASPPANSTPRKEGETNTAPGRVETKTDEVSPESTLTPKQQREEKANRYITAQATNPLLKSILDKKP